MSRAIRPTFRRFRDAAVLTKDFRDDRIAATGAMDSRIKEPYQSRRADCDTANVESFILQSQAPAKIPDYCVVIL